MTMAMGSAREYFSNDEQLGRLKVSDLRPSNSVIFYANGNPTEDNEIMRLSAEGVKVNPKFTVDEATGYVIKALDSYLKGMAQKEYERGVVDGMQKQLKQIVEKEKSK